MGKGKYSRREMNLLIRVLKRNRLLKKAAPIGLGTTGKRPEATSSADNSAQANAGVA